MSQDNIIQGFWFGTLGPMEKLSIKSYLALGYEYHLYSYDLSVDVPEGCILKDASSVRPYSPTQHLSYMGDIIRCDLLYMYGGWWSDLDAICVKRLDFDAEYVFAYEEHVSNIPWVNNAVMKAPVGSPLMKWAAEQCELKKNTVGNASQLGPHVTNEGVNRFNLQEFVLQPEAFYPIAWWNWKDYLNGKYKIKDFPNTYVFHLWNDMWRRSNQSKDVFTGIYEELRNYVH